MHVVRVGMDTAAAPKSPFLSRAPTCLGLVCGIARLGFSTGGPPPSDPLKNLKNGGVCLIVQRVRTVLSRTIDYIAKAYLAFVTLLDSVHGGSKAKTKTHEKFIAQNIRNAIIYNPRDRSFVFRKFLSGCASCPQSCRPSPRSCLLANWILLLTSAWSRRRRCTTSETVPRVS